MADDNNLSITSPPTLMMRIRPVALKRGLRNLIDNSIRYGDRADIELDGSGDDIVITITDHGPGLPEDQLEAVFEPFYRHETSRNRDTGGAGLGLAIARSAIRAPWWRHIPQEPS
ncbi:MAG: ATP-binding protein [Roseovarius sp.]|nr:ATP-binding protein [Roseovarius sp.]